MYSTTVRDHIMVAHSLSDKIFGSAQQLHGATYIVDAEFKSPVLDVRNTVINIGKASEVLRDVCTSLNYQNLNDHPELANQFTTTEYLAQVIHQKICKKIKSFFSGSLRVVLHESHIAWGSYEGVVE